MIELKEVSYEYDDGTKALDGVSLEIKEGEKVALVGQNGAGKTTLLHVIAGLKKSSRGSASVCGSTGLLFQDPDDQIFMPRVWDDVAFGPMNQKTEKCEIERRVEWAMGAAGISGFGNRAPHHLSIGEKKRVAVAGLLAMKVDIFLLDEPTANLDPKGARELLALILELGGTHVISTHDMAVAAKCDRTFIMHRGKVVWAGKGAPDDVLDRYELR